jgi:trk system potassium uptake protein TrkA
VHVVIVGCGRVGSSLARDLLADGHTVAVIDRRGEAFDRLGPDFPGTRVQGIGFDRDRLVEAGIERAGAVAAVTSGDNSNILVARVARETFGVDRVVARIYDPRRAAIYQRLGITTVATVAWTTDQVRRRLLPERRPPEWTDPTATVCLLDRTVDDHWAGELLTDLEEALGARVVAINRMGAATTPTGRTVAQAGDVLYLAVETARVAAVDAALTTPRQGH